MAHFRIGVIAPLIFFVQLSRADSVSASIDRYLQDVIKAKETPGISVAVCRNGKPIYQKGFGYAELQNSVRATSKTVYRIGSVTKQFTSAIIMQLEREGKLGLDDPASKYIDGLPPTWSKVTIRHLLTHTSGIPSYTNLPNFLEQFSHKSAVPKDILNTVIDKPLEFEPGSKWEYNNTGYVMLGMVIEKVDGRPYGKSLHARIIDPLGMTQTFFTSEQTVVPNRAQGYTWGQKGFDNSSFINMDWPYAAGSMESTVEDLAKWDAALYTEKILPVTSWKQVWTPYVLSTGVNSKYGFGWIVDKRDGVDYVEHGGGINGFTCGIKRIVSKGLTIIVLTNSETADPNGNATKIAGLVDPSLKPKVVASASDSDPAMTKAARELFAGALQGNLDRTKLTPECSKQISPEMVAQVHEKLSSIGKLTTFELMSDSSKDGLRTRTYLAKIGARDFKIKFVTNAKGLIEDIDISR